MLKGIYISNSDIVLSQSPLCMSYAHGFKCAVFDIFFKTPDVSILSGFQPFVGGGV